MGIILLLALLGSGPILVTLLKFIIIVIILAVIVYAIAKGIHMFLHWYTGKQISEGSKVVNTAEKTGKILSITQKKIDLRSYEFDVEILLYPGSKVETNSVTYIFAYYDPKMKVGLLIIKVGNNEYPYKFNFVTGYTVDIVTPETKLLDENKIIKTYNTIELGIGVLDVDNNMLTIEKNSSGGITVVPSGSGSRTQEMYPVIHLKSTIVMKIPKKNK